MTRPRLGDVLLELGYITQEDLDSALRMQEAEGGVRRFGEIVREFVVRENEILEALSRQHDIPIIREEQLPEVLPLDKVSYEFLERNLVLPLSVSDGTLQVAVADPGNTDALESLRASFDYRVVPFLASPTLLQAHIDRLKASKDAVMQQLLEGVSEESVGEEAGEVSHLRDLAQEKGIIQLANLIIENAIRDEASDIHVEPEETTVRVRYRIDGILYDREMLPLKTQAALASRIKLLAQMNIAERRLPQDGRIKGRFSGREVDIRVSTLPTVYGESIVMRILDKEASFISLEGLGFDQQLLTLYEKLIARPFGMILITGPTGSGKTTTLYASLDKINTPDKKIITIEEPVEYLLRGINQIQVRPKIGLTFANGLRSIVRQDPDIVMVGEIRDLETAGIGVHAALTGHLLFSTLHTNDAPSAITRLVDMGVEHYLVASTLIGVVAQRLVRRVCRECAEAVPVPDEVRRELAADAATVWRGRGCENCMNTGYKGRIAIFELLDIGDDVRNLIMSKANAREIKDRAITLGMRTLRHDGMLKVSRGITTVDEVFRVTQAET